MKAVEGRFGAEGLRSLDRTGTFEKARLGQADPGALVEVGRFVQAARGGGRAVEGVTQRLSAVPRIGKVLKP